MRTLFLLGLVAWMLLIQPVALLAGTESSGLATRQAQRYQSCLAETARNADAAYEMAVDWRVEGGGDPARHCEAVALVELGHFEPAAERLQALAERSTGALQASLYNQAGTAWALSGMGDKALFAFDAAVRGAPGNVEFLVDRALARASYDDFESAEADLSRALALDPGRPAILAYRAAARRGKGDLAGAEADADAALALDPSSAFAHMERGNIARLSGDAASARKNWQAVIEIAPESDMAATAEVNLSMLEEENPTPSPPDQVDRDSASP